jgi:hypothetical protein
MNQYRFFTTTKFVAFIGILFSLNFFGCELSTELPKTKNTPKANHLIINEVFAIPPTKQNTYSWIEIYNPTQLPVQQLSLQILGTNADSIAPRDTLALKAYYLKFRSDVFFENPFTPFQPPMSAGTQNVYIPLSSLIVKEILTPMDEISFEEDSIIAAQGFAVYTNNPLRLLEHTDLGGSGPLYKPFIFNMDTLVDIGALLQSGGDSVNKSFQVFTLFQLPASCEIMLVERTDTIARKLRTLNFSGFQIPFIYIDSIWGTNETILDIVRYGNFVPTGIIQPKNKSAGFIPETHSLARYSGGYFTGNTITDFYFEPQPIPMWHSKLRHP